MLPTTPSAAANKLLTVIWPQAMPRPLSGIALSLSQWLVIGRKRLKDLPTRSRFMPPGVLPTTEAGNQEAMDDVSSQSNADLACGLLEGQRIGIAAAKAASRYKRRAPTARARNAQRC